MCPHCGSLEVEAVELSGRGTVYSYALLHHPQHPAFDYPVLAVLVDLDEGIRLVSNLTDIEPARRPHRHAASRSTSSTRPTGAALPVFRPARERRERPMNGPHDRLKVARRSPGSVRPSSRVAPVGASCSSPAKSITAALAEAGVPAGDVDGLVSYTIDPVEETELVRSVGFREIA